MESIQFVWQHGGGHVLLAGCFNQWKGVPMQLINGFWQATLPLSSGQYHYKFIVDGIWKYDHQKTIVDDGHGNVNNLLIVGHQSPQVAGLVGRSAPVPKKEEIKPDLNKNKPQPEDKKKEDPKAKPQDPKAKPGENKQPKPQDKKKEDPKAKPKDPKTKPEDPKAKPGEVKEKKKGSSRSFSRSLGKSSSQHHYWQRKLVVICQNSR